MYKKISLLRVAHYPLTTYSLVAYSLHRSLCTFLLALGVFALEQAQVHLSEAVRKVQAEHGHIAKAVCVLNEERAFGILIKAAGAEDVAYVERKGCGIILQEAALQGNVHAVVGFDISLCRGLGAATARAAATGSKAAALVNGEVGFGLIGTR